MAPLRDSRGKLRYYIGAQVDVSGLAKEATDLEGLQRMLADESEGGQSPKNEKDELQMLSEMFNLAELDIVKKNGGRMHREHVTETNGANASWNRPRLLLKDQYSEDDVNGPEQQPVQQPNPVHGRLTGVYSHVS